MCFFSPNTDALIPLRSYATPDRAPDHLADGTPAALRDDLISLLGATAVRSRVTDLVKYATDASPYKQQSIQAKTLTLLPYARF
jgi:D-lactate dehydrogenase